MMYTLEQARVARWELANRSPARKALDRTLSIIASGAVWGVVLCVIVALSPFALLGWMMEVFDRRR